MSQKGKVFIDFLGLLLTQVETFADTFQSVYVRVIFMESHRDMRVPIYVIWQESIPVALSLEGLK